MKLARFWMRYDSLAGALIIEVSADIAQPILDSVRQHLWPEVEYMTLELFDATNDQGYEFKGLTKMSNNPAGFTR